MYQKPDFIKVDLDIKDNFAAYGDDCDEIIDNHRTVKTACGEGTYQRMSEAWAVPESCYTRII